MSGYDSIHAALVDLPESFNLSWLKLGRLYADSLLFGLE